MKDGQGPMRLLPVEVYRFEVDRTQPNFGSRLPDL